ncbi:hypothetical protein CDD80_2539 [Ophiocordyceps camponoti-rufipedis]|uniref:3'(2'),5'-bisphosphate nucleotidase n=1 Tax=Ophiocordyceps camponoti-rufipedis TaxID=2004952 RepID=A0A2C5XK51_9HYPO|nr:hypothetical protein CDD80_2539 [Ophiocordyceps camponoti-rufipedis]
MPPFTHELQVAQRAVRRAATLTAAVFAEASKGTISKSDASPVTVGDFGAQAVIAAALRREFPDDDVVAEEEAALLRGDGAAAKLRGLVWRGHAKGGRQGRFWTIDPIDGTKGFLRGGQYAVCLALIIDSDVKVGVLACPNLPVSDEARLTDLNTDTTSHRGVLFSAIAGQGATSQPLDGSSPPRPITMRPIRDLSLATFCESVEAAHSAHGDQAAIANHLGITQASVRLDSQAKYGSIARGAGDIYLRLPVKADYQEKIWDHAAGDLIVREAGGCVTDIYGKRLDFGVGRTLANNKGVVAAPVAIHPEVLKAVQQVLNIEK